MVRVSKEKKIEEIEKNYEFFKSNLSELLETHKNTYALIRQRKILNYFKTIYDAEKFAREKFDDNLYSIQKITNKPIELGIFSRAFNQR